MAGTRYLRGSLPWATTTSGSMSAQRAPQPEDQSAVEPDRRGVAPGLLE